MKIISPITFLRAKECSVRLQMRRGKQKTLFPMSRQFTGTRTVPLIMPPLISCGSANSDIGDFARLVAEPKIGDLARRRRKILAF